MSGDTDKLAQIAACAEDAEGGRWCCVETADVLALVEIARKAQAVTEHHFDTCDLVLGEYAAYPCSCGIDALRLALLEVEEK